MALVQGKWLADIIVKEAPTGAVNGINTSFTLSQAPLYDDADVYANGLLQRQGVDYTVSGTAISFTSAPASGVQLWAIYLKR